MPLASRAETSVARETISNLRNLLDVKLAYDRGHKDAFQQCFKRHAEIVGPLPQECPISPFKVTWSKFYDGVRRFTVSARDSMVRATIETGISLVNRNYRDRKTIFLEWYTWAMKIISTAEAAKRLGVTPDRVRKMIEAKRLKATKFGNVWMIDPKDLDALKDRKVGRPRKSRKTTKKGIRSN
jgi:excisionase family DNA binding protein